MQTGELELLSWLKRTVSRRTLRKPPGDVYVADDFGDDMARLRFEGGTLLLGTDMLLDMVHFDSRNHSPEQIGTKAVCACLSDCAAMAVQPVGFLTSIALPRAQMVEIGKRVLDSMQRTAAEYDCPLLGGDLTSWTNPLVIDVTMVGRPWPGIKPIARRGAGCGDALFVTGPLGGSLLQHHLDFRPRIDAARQLAERLGADLKAMMDISDGLALDLHRLCGESQCGALLDEQLLETVISDDARALAKQDGRTPLEHALTDGEDFELLLAVSSAGVSKVQELDIKLVRIGEVTAGGLHVQQRDGQRVTLRPGGYAH